MHEFELGVWKDHFKHILRVLHAYGGDRITVLNERYMWALLNSGLFLT